MRLEPVRDVQEVRCNVADDHSERVDSDVFLEDIMELFQFLEGFGDVNPQLVLPVVIVAHS